MKQIIDKTNNYLRMMLPMNSEPLYVKVIEYLQMKTGKTDYQKLALHKIYSCMKSNMKNIVGLRIVIDKCKENNNCQPLLILEDLGFIMDYIVNDNKCDYFHTFILWIPDIVNTYLKEINVDDLANKMKTAINELSDLQNVFTSESLNIEHTVIKNKFEQLGLYDLVNTIIKQIQTHVSSSLGQQVVALKNQLEYMKHSIEPQKLVENFFNYRNSGLDKKEILSRILDNIIKEYVDVYHKYNKLIRQVEDLSHIVFLLRILIDNYFDPEGFIKLKQELETVYQLIYILNPSIYPDEYLSRSISTLIFEELKDKLRTMYIDADTRHQLISLIDRLSTNLINIIKERIE